MRMRRPHRGAASLPARLSKAGWAERRQEKILSKKTPPRKRGKGSVERRKHARIAVAAAAKAGTGTPPRPSLSQVQRHNAGPGLAKAAHAENTRKENSESNPSGHDATPLVCSPRAGLSPPDEIPDAPDKPSVPRHQQPPANHQQPANNPETATISTQTPPASNNKPSQQPAPDSQQPTANNQQPNNQPASRTWKEERWRVREENRMRKNDVETKKLKRQLYSLHTLTQHQRKEIAQYSQGLRALRLELRQRWGCNNRRLREIQRDATKARVIRLRNLRNMFNKFISPTDLQYNNYSNFRVYKCFEKWKGAHQYRLTNGRDRTRHHNEFRDRETDHLKDRLYDLAVPEYNLTGADEDEYISEIRRELAKWEGFDGSRYYRRPRQYEYEYNRLPGDTTKAPAGSWWMQGCNIRLPGEYFTEEDCYNDELNLAWDYTDAQLGTPQSGCPPPRYTSYEDDSDDSDDTRMTQWEFDEIQHKLACSQLHSSQKGVLTDPKHSVKNPSLGQYVQTYGAWPAPATQRIPVLFKL